MAKFLSQIDLCEGDSGRGKGESSKKKRAELESFWRAHHESWQLSDLNERILRATRAAVEALWQLAGALQGRKDVGAGQFARAER